ncbi:MULTISPECIES: ABC transporter permease subunit [unclassified Nonomuraea]|uniref:ABC transporter permease n=1 Tax=unclassified Nonomuraea TaxID=2593643 RepID=UPI0033FBF771
MRDRVLDDQLTHRAESQDHDGWINTALRRLGVGGAPSRLSDPAWVIPGLVMIGLWGLGSGIIINLAGLRGIPTALYDAARLDGAGWLRRLRHVTIPMMSPVIFYTMILAVVEVVQYLLNTIALAVISTIGTVLSCTLVACGFARFPGRGPLFTLLIATIFLPSAVTLIPTYTVFAQIGWVVTWLPLLVPAFFANAYSVFLLRQYFLTIPREMDEAASIDGAGPLRTLRSVIVPQAWPAITAVTLFNFVYTWNDYFTPLVYLSGRPELQPLQVGLAAFNGLYSTKPAYIQAGAMMTIAVPVILLICFQRTFVRGIMSTGVER